ncbi:MAG TPA: hypothetical protein VHO50_05755, partial [Bacteroidales bacterium]|nr:hypothetical protein [Bacteroidales bacterium]
MGPNDSFASLNQMNEKAQKIMANEIARYVLKVEFKDFEKLHKFTSISEALIRFENYFLSIEEAVEGNLVHFVESCY